MHKLKTRAFSLLLALAMVLSLLPATALAEGEAVSLAGWSVTLSDKIGVNFYLNIDESAVSTTTVTIDGVAATPTLDEDGYYVVSCDKAAARMNDDIALSVKNGDTEVVSGVYSVLDYATKVINGEYDEQVKTLVKHMLNFGAAAQTYFNYKANDLVNAGITVTETEPAGDTSFTVEGALSGITLYGASLVYQSQTAVRFYFNAPAGVADYTFRIGQDTYQAQTKNGLYYVEVNGINPQNLADSITIQVTSSTDTENTLTATYSPLTYMIRKYTSASSSDALKALVKAMYSYHLSAVDYQEYLANLPTVIDAGAITAGGSWNADSLSFGLAENEAVINDATRYKPEAAANIKLIRGGVTYDVGNVDRESLVKSGATSYYIPLWVLGDYKPLVANDILIIEGNFVNAATNTTLNITKSYLLINADGTATASTTEPEPETVIDVTGLASHANGWTSESTSNAGGLYFSAAENDAPYSDWNVRYTPVSADCIQLTRDGVTTSVGNTGAEMITKFSTTEYYLEFWPISAKPILAGDVITIQGKFYNAANDVYINIENTTIIFGEDKAATFVSDSDKYIEAGVMSASGGANWFGNGIYFNLADNNAPSAADWSMEYKPATASVIKLIRGGETYAVANTGGGTLKKIDAVNKDGVYENYWLKLESYVVGGYTIEDGDILVIEGAFVNPDGYTLNISKTYITFEDKANDVVVFSSAIDTDFGEVLLPASNDSVTFGIWNGSYHVFDETHLQYLQDIGVSKIMGIDTKWIGTSDVTAWLDRMEQYGMSVIMDLRGWDGTTVPEWASHEAILGFLMYDEPCATEFNDLADLKAQFDAVDAFSGKLFYVNLYPSCAAGTDWAGDWNWNTGKRDYDVYYVTQFLEKLNIEVLSWDNYSLLTDGTNKGIRTDYFYNFEVMASKASDSLPLWYTMLSAGHPTSTCDYVTPSEDELRWQMAVAMTYGVQNIDHYTYVSHDTSYSSMMDYNTMTPTDLYNDVKTVAQEVMAWDEIFMAYDWVGVAAHNVTGNSMMSKLSKGLTLSSYGVSSVTSAEDLLIGVFDHNGDKAYMVTNAGGVSSTAVGDGVVFTCEDASVTLNLASGDYKCVAIIDNGVVRYEAVSNNSVTFTVEAYEGVFVIPVLN